MNGFIGDSMWCLLFQTPDTVQSGAPLKYLFVFSWINNGTILLQSNVFFYWYILFNGSVTFGIDRALPLNKKVIYPTYVAKRK